MKNYIFFVKYDGSKYNGWQRLQENSEKSIQGKIETVLSRLLEEDIKIIGSGRTDAGVHALQQVCNFRTDAIINNDFILNFNHYLPDDIKIIEFKEVDERFHARYNATSKIYMYRIDNTTYGDPFLRKFSYYIENKLDLVQIENSFNIFLGTHDFTSFSKNNSKKKSCIRTIKNITIQEKDGIIEIYFEGDGFLYNMVRMIVGTLVNIGLHKTSLKEVKLLLESKSRENHRFVAPPQGLFLCSVKY